MEARLDGLAAGCGDVLRAVRAAKRRTPLLRALCARLLEVGDYLAVWVARTERGDAGRLSWAAHEGSLQPASAAPAALARLPNGEPRVWRDAHEDGDIQAILEAQGSAPVLRTTAAFPLSGDEDSQWTLWVHAADPDAFGAFEAALIAQTAAAAGAQIEALRLDSERGRLARALRRSEQRLRHYFDLPLVGTAIVSPQRQWVQVNDKLADMLGYAPDELRGRTWEELAPTSDLPAVLRHVTSLLAGDEECFQCDSRINARDGGTVDVHLTARCVRRADGQPDHVALLVQDITAQKTAERRLKQSRETFRTLAENVPAVVYLCRNDARYTMLFLNDAVEEVTGIPAQRFLDDDVSFVELYHPDDAPRIAPQVDGAVAQHEPFRLLYRLRHADGSWRWIDEHGQGVFDAHGALRYLVGSLLDVTDRVEGDANERELHEQMLQTQKLESLGVLAGGIAHDFNNLLTAMLGNANLALLHVGEEEAAHRPLEGIVAAAERAAKLTREMLAYSGTRPVELVPADVCERVREISHLLTSSLPKKVELEMGLADDLPAVRADMAQLQQLVLNLVLNGAEAIGDDVGVVRVTTGAERLDAATLGDFFPRDDLRPGTFVFVRVADDGCGMSDAVRARMFDPFFTTKFTGRGLGLATVLGIVRGHSGGLRVVTREGEGTTVTVVLPVCGDAEPITAEIPSDELQGSGTVLVVDDEELVRETARSALEYYGYDVLTAEDGVHAVEVFREHGAEIDLVLLDMMMPRMDGAETFHALRELDPNVQVILSSGYTETMTGRQFRSTSDLAGFVQKPYSPRRLARRVRAVCDRVRG